MRNILFVAVLMAAAACGKKGGANDTPKGDCTASVTNAMDLSKEDFKKSNVDDATIPKIRDASIERCKQDKWTDQVLKCLVDAKASDDIKKCQQMMTKEQNDNMAKAITAAMATQPPESPPEATGSGSGSAAEAGGDVAGLPPECNDYKAMIEKLAACDKLPQASRDMLKKTFETTAKTWENFDKLPADAKTALTNGCKQGAEALKKSAGAACGW